MAYRLTCADIIEAARSEIGTPFRHQGRVAGKRLDCAGLIVRVAELLGVQVADQKGYSRLPSRSNLESAIDVQQNVFRVLGEPKAGDILLLRFGKDPQHLAIFTGENIIHSTNQTGRVVEERFDAIWRLRLVRIYRFAGVSHE